MHRLIRWLNIGLVLLTIVAYVVPYVSPALLWPLSILAPLVPWLLLANFLMLLFFIYTRSPAGFVSLACLLLGWPLITRLLAWPTQEVAPPSEISLRAMSFNCHVFRPEGALELSPPREVAQDLAAIGADIIFLQEFPNRDAADPYAEAIRREAELPHYYQPKGAGLAIFSRYPIEIGQSKFYANRVNGYFYVDLDTPAGTLRVFNVHLQSNAITGLAGELVTDNDFQQKKTWARIKRMFHRYSQAAVLRTQQVGDLAALIRNSPHTVLLGGDFNDVPSSYVYETIQDTQLQDAFLYAGRGLGVTYAGHLPGLRIDYLWTTAGLEATRFAVGRLPYSDHRPVIADFSLQP